jgi:hypothetical protein
MVVLKDRYPEYLQIIVYVFSLLLFVSGLGLMLHKKMGVLCVHWLFFYIFSVSCYFSIRSNKPKLAFVFFGIHDDRAIIDTGQPVHKKMHRLELDIDKVNLSILFNSRVAAGSKYRKYYLLRFFWFDSRSAVLGKAASGAGQAVGK